MQVIDARDPLTYRSSDLENYARDIARHKGSMMLLNKSDLLPEVRAEASWTHGWHGPGYHDTVVMHRRDISAVNAQCRSTPSVA